MLAKIESIGGYAKPRKDWEAMRLKAESNVKTVMVLIKTKARDTRQTIKDEKGKDVANPMYGKFIYTSEHSMELEDATPGEVKEAVLRGIAAASKK